METHFFNKTLDKSIHYVRYSLKHIDLNQKFPIQYNFLETHQSRQQNMNSKCHEMEIRSCTCNQLPFLYVDLQSQGGVSYLNDSSVFPAERDHKIIISFIKIKITMNPNEECQRLLHWKAQSLAPPAKPNYSQRETQI